MRLPRTSLLLVTVVISLAALLLTTNDILSQEEATGFLADDAEVTTLEFDLTEVYRGLPRDAIPPLYLPKHVLGTDVDWLPDSEFVIGLSLNGNSRAYPLLILNFHEIVNDRVGDRDILVSYCPLCRSGIVYDRQLKGTVLQFGNEGSLYEANLLMYDHQTDSLWWQILGVAVDGDLKGSRLQVLPSIMTTWGEWKQFHPNTLLLSLDTGYDRPYVERDPFYRYDLEEDSEPSYPHSELDPRLLPKTNVIGITFNGEHKAYTLPKEGKKAINDRVDGMPIVILMDGSTQSGTVFFANLEGARLRFEVREGKVLDKATGSTWNLLGEAIEGPLYGKNLLQIASYPSYWFSWSTAFPDTDLEEV